MRYYGNVIRSFADTATEAVFQRQYVRKLSPMLQRAAYRKLVQLHVATALETMGIPPGNHLQKLSGRRQGQHSIRINDQWRICFVWRDGDVHDVEIVDYH